jgi:SAM-dependent methyltransferase
MKRISPRQLAVRALGLVSKSKYAAETSFWKQSIRDYVAWYNGDKKELFGTPSPKTKEKVVVRNAQDSAILTWTNLHQKAKYLYDLDLPKNAFKGMKLLDVGAGPIPSATCFEGATLFALDPLYDQYLTAGFPLHYWGNTTFVKAFAEDMPIEDAFFDAVISVNAIDHVDDLAKTAQEIRRVLKKGGKFAMHVHYHAATPAEPLEITDKMFKELFGWVPKLKKVKVLNTKLGGWKIPEGESYVLWKNF